MDMLGLQNLLRPPEEETALVPMVTPATLGQHLPAAAADDDGEYFYTYDHFCANASSSFFSGLTIILCY